MTAYDRSFLSALWLRLTGNESWVDGLLQQVKRDGGHDMSKLSIEDLAQLMDGQFLGNWNEPAFSFSELLAYYSVLGQKHTNEQIVAWIFSAFVISDAVEHGAAEWELNFDNFINGFNVLRHGLETEEIVYIFQRVFGPPLGHASPK